MQLAEERYKKILDILKEREFVTTNELIEVLGVSRETVRRDVLKLTNRGVIVKTHGGLASADNAFAAYNVPIALREATNIQDKRRVCRCAFQYISNEDYIFIDNSTTAAQLIHMIPKYYEITLITYSIRLLNDIANLGSTKWQVISLGGIFNPGTSSTGYNLTLSNFSIFKPQLAFVSCHGIDRDFCVTDSNLFDIEIKRAVLASAQRTILLADASKIDQNGVMKVADAGDFSRVITNKGADPAFVARLKAHGCQVELAGD